MAINWGTIERKTIETGVDRGVLYTGTDSVPWDGLVSVTEKSDDRALTPNYIQGIVYHVSKEPGNFSASVEAYSYPDEFEPFQGMYEIEAGLFADNQSTLNTFDFSYRTLIADGINGLGAGYKIHLVYNAIAIPTETQRNTVNDSIEASNFTWDVVCSAIYPKGMRPTAHFVVDSRRLTAAQLTAIENLIYGPNGQSSPSFLPDISIISKAASGTIAVDAFKRPNSSTSLGNTDTGLTWATVNGTWGIISNTAYMAVGSAVRGHASVDIGTVNHAVQAKIGVQSGNPGVVGRFINENNCYLFQTDNVVAERNVKVRVGGVTTILIPNIPIPTGATIRLELSDEAGGCRVVAKVNGVQVGSVLDTTPGRPTGTKTGLFAYNNTARFDDFLAESI